MSFKKWWTVFAVGLLLTGCGQPAVTESISSKSSEPSESVSTPEPQYATEDITDHGKVSMDFDEIRPAGFHQNEGVVPTVETGMLQYFTIQRGDKWGLILADGTQISPCISNDPINLCPAGHWCFTGKWGWDLNDAISEETLLLTDRMLCPAHGGKNTIRYMVLGEDSVPKLWVSTEVGGHSEEIPESVYPDFYVPTYFTTVIDPGGDPKYLAPDGYWNFTNEAGEVLVPGEQFSLASEFSPNGPAAVQKDGKWAYLNQEGTLITDYIYESCWASDSLYHAENKKHQWVNPAYAYPFYDGYAAVKKDGKWGVIDKNGTEWIPCEYEGAAPHPLGVWLKKDGVWEVRRLNLNS